MSIVFFIPLLVIALIEAHLKFHANGFMASWFSRIDEGEEDDPHIQNPSCEDSEELEITRTSFEDLVDTFPNIKQVRYARIQGYID